MKTIKLQGFEEKEAGIYYEYDADSIPLGEGAMGRVYVGTCINIKTKKTTPVAIKAIYDNIPDSVIERARREAAVRVDSPYLLHMLGFIEQPFPLKMNGHVTNVMRYFVIMELLEGVTLYDMMQGRTSDASGNVIPKVKALHDSYITDKEVTIQTIISKTLRGVKALHNEGFIHRDIDPTNIMITSEGHVKLIDFGICKRINTLGTSDKNLTATGLFMGKVGYASPELIIGDVQHQNCSTDIYALGILLFQLCTGHLPYSGSDNEILLAHMRKRLPLKEIKNSPFKKIIVKATQKSQSGRFESADQMLADVDNVDFSNKNYWGGIIAFVVVICAFGAGYSIWEYSHQKDDNLPMDGINEFVTIDEINEFVTENTQIVVENEFDDVRKRLWSNDKQVVYDAFQDLAQMAKKKGDVDAMFEYGLSFSAGNEIFDMPTKRQRILKIDVDIARANYWLELVQKEEPDNYRAVYWQLNNLIQKKGKDPNSVFIAEINDLLDRFDNLTVDKNDKIANKYKEAIERERGKIRKWQ